MRGQYGDTSDKDGCSGEENFDTSFESFEYVFVILFEFVAGGDIPFHCLRSTSSSYLTVPMISECQKRTLDLFVSSKDKVEAA